MSIRDKQQKRGRQDEQAVNLAAIAQHQAVNVTSPIVQQTGKTPAQVQQEIYGNPGGMTDAELQRSVHPAAPTQTIATTDTEVKEMTTETNATLETPVTKPTRIVGETESSPGLDALNNNGKVPSLILDTTYIDPTPEEQTMELTNKEVIVAWVKTNSAINTANLININLSTMTGDILVNELGLPTSIPKDVVTALLAEIETAPVLGKYNENLPTMVKLISNEQEEVVTSKALDLLLLVAKPHIEAAISKWDNFVAVVNSFIKAPTEEAPIEITTKVIDTPPESIAERCKRIQAEADAKRKAANGPTTTELSLKHKPEPTTNVGALVTKQQPGPTIGDLVAEQQNHKSILDIMADRKK